jgi:hypothetical protein
VPTYSTRLYIGPVPTAWTTLFTTTEATTIIRDIEVTNNGGSSETVNFSVSPVSPAPPAFLMVVPLLGTTQHFQWQGRVVLGLGDQLLGYCAGAGVTCIISGYVFGT